MAVVALGVKGKLLVVRKGITSWYLADNLILFLKTWIHNIAASGVYFFWVYVLVLTVSYTSHVLAKEKLKSGKLYLLLLQNFLLKEE